MGNALNHLYTRLYEAGYIKPSTTFAAATNWTLGRVPTTDDLTHYLKCVGIVREAMAQFETTPHTPADTGALNYIEANNIELILTDIEILINNMLAARHFCGEVYAGEI